MSHPGRCVREDRGAIGLALLGERDLVELDDEARWGRALRGEPDGGPSGPEPAWVPVDDRARLGRLLARAGAGERVEVCAPGLDAAGRRVLVRAFGGAP